MSVPEMSTSLWISLRLEATGMRIRQIDPPIIPSPGRCLRGLVLPSNVWVAVPFGQEFGYPANHSECCRERIEHELEKEPEGASKVAPGTRSDPE